MKSLTKTLTFAVAALSVSAAQAIDKSSPKILMDNGFGSEAVNSWTDYSGFDPEINIVGRKFDMFGRSQPAAWNYDPSLGLVIVEALPAMGLPGECLAGRSFPDGSQVAVGNLITPSGVARAVVWRRVTGMDDWESPKPLAPGSVASICGHEITHGIQADVPGSIQQNGRTLPVVFVKVDVDITHTLLPIPPNAQGQALTIDGDPGARVVGGWMQIPGRPRKPVTWEENGTGWTLTPVQVAANVGGQVNDVSSLFNAGFVGTQFRNGRSMGFYTDSLGNNLVGLRPLDGFHGSTAYNLGDTGTHEVGHIIFGGSFNGSNNPTATCWIDQTPYPAQQLLTDPGAVGQVLGFQWGVGRGALGTVMQSAGALRQACLFVPTGVQAPDRLNVLVGQALGEGDLSAMWHDDGEMLAVRTERVNGQRMACVDIDFTPLAFSAGQDARMDAQLMAPNQVNGGTINVYFLNHSTGQFESIYSNNIGGGLLGITANVPSAAQHPTSGQVRIRLEFKHNGNQPRTLAIGVIAVSHE